MIIFIDEDTIEREEVEAENDKDERVYDVVTFE